MEDYRAAQQARLKARNRSLALYALSLGVVTLGLSYAAVPLYRAFCSATGFGGTPMTSITKGEGKFAPERLKALVAGEGQKERWITVRFNADSSDALPWKFWPCQRSVRVRPGETALAFYKAKNMSDKDILGIATYNVTPGQVHRSSFHLPVCLADAWHSAVQIAPYFAKVECFCFDEQRLLAGEEVDLPIFFFIDQDFADDPLMRDIDDVVLSYTFLWVLVARPRSPSLEWLTTTGWGTQHGSKERGQRTVGARYPSRVLLNAACWHVVHTLASHTPTPRQRDSSCRTKTMRDFLRCPPASVV